MANNRWLGKALDVTQVDTITITGSWVATDTITVTMGGLDLVLTINEARTDADAAASLSAAINATSATNGVLSAETRNVGGQEIPEMQEVSATVSGAVVTVTHDQGGVPFTMTVAEAGGGTAVRATSVVATGKHFLDNADNWSDGIPTADDVLIFDSGSVSLKYGLTHLRSGTQVESGTDDTGAASKLTEAGQNFDVTVTVGDTVFNTTNTTEAIVTGIDSATVLSLSADIMSNTDTYTIGTGIETEMIRTTDYSGDIGLPVQNVLGYREYRQRQLQLYNKSFDKEIIFREGVFGGGFGGVTRLDLEDQLYTEIQCLDSGPVGNEPSVEITGGWTDIYHAKGYMAIDPPDALPVTSPWKLKATWNIGASGIGDRETKLYIGEGQHSNGVQTMSLYSGGVESYTELYTSGSYSISPVIFGGTWTQIVYGSLEDVTVRSDGIFNWDGGGTVTGDIYVQARGVLDISRTTSYRLYSNTITAYSGAIIRAFTTEISALSFVGCQREDVTITAIQ